MSKLLFTAIAMFMFLFVVQIETKAQRLKVGDRVEDVQITPEKGVVKEVDPDPKSNCYLILFDYHKHTGAKGNRVCIYDYTNRLFLLDSNDRRVRDANAPTGTQNQQTNNTPTNNQNAQTGNVPPLCTGELLLNPKTKGQAANAALFKDVIKSLWDAEPDSKGWGRRVTAINSLTVGTAYRWSPNVDFQSLGTKPKTVYPVKVKYMTCQEQMLEWRLTESTNEELYSCYVDDQFGNWTCAIQKAGTFKKSYITKP